jgi:uncharacterized protein
VTDAQQMAATAQSILMDTPAPGDVVRLRASYCVSCDRWEFPARSYCPTCSASPEERPLSSEAKVALTTAVLHQPPGALVEAPYTVALAEFPEGISIMGVVSDRAFEDVRIGQPLTTVAVQVGNSLGYAFVVTDGG